MKWFYCNSFEGKSVHMGAEPQLGFLVLNLCARDCSCLCFLSKLATESAVQQGGQPNPAMCIFSVLSFGSVFPLSALKIHSRIPNISVLLKPGLPYAMTGKPLRRCLFFSRRCRSKPGLTFLSQCFLLW